MSLDGRSDSMVGNPSSTSVRLSRSPRPGKLIALTTPALLAAIVARAFWQDPALGLLALFASFLMSILVAGGQIQFFRGLVDEADDCGNHLSFRSGGTRQDVLLETVTSIAIDRTLGGRVVVEFEVPGSAGGRFAFLPRSILSLTSARMVDDLMQRVGQARRLRETGGLERRAN